jgi:hypothetical protein
VVQRVAAAVNAIKHISAHSTNNTLCVHSLTLVFFSSFKKLGTTEKRSGIIMQKLHKKTNCEIGWKSGLCKLIYSETCLRKTQLRKFPA